MVLKAEGIKKAYGKSRKKRAAFRLQIDDFRVEEGSFTAILGPNGSGKTTFLKIILDLLFSDEGQVELLGKDHKNKEARSGLGYLPENFSFPKFFTVKEMLLSFGGIGQNDKAQLKEQIAALADVFKVDYLGERMKSLSKGMTQTAALMHTFLGDHQFYILDEPFNGLDAVQKKAVMHYLLDLKEKRKVSILITTHILSDIDKICDTIHLIKDGDIIHSASKPEIQQQFGSVEDYYLHHFEPKEEAML